MEEKNKLSNRQIKALLVSTIVGVGILTLPNRIALVYGNDGWIPIILSGLLVIPIIWMMSRVFEMYPNKNFFEIGREVLGKWLFNLFLIIFLLYLVMSMAYIVRLLGELVRAFLLETTPMEVLIISFLLVTTYIARDSIQVLGRLGYLVYPIIIGFVIFLILISLPELDFTNLLPVFQSNIENLPRSIEISFFSYLGYEILFFALPLSENRRENVKYASIGLIIVIVIYTLLFLLALSQYGIYSLKRQIYPTLSLVKEVDLPGYFIENLDGIAMAIWVLIIFPTLASPLYSSGRILANLFNTKDHSLFIVPIIPIIYAIALIPENLSLERELSVIINYLGFISTVIFPILIYLVGLFKARRQER